MKLKKVLVMLLTFIFMLTVCTAAFAAEKKLTDYEGADMANVLNGIPDKIATASFETSNPLSGKKSFAITYDSTSTDGGSSGFVYMKPFGGVTDWSGYDYLGIRIKNTQDSAVSMPMLIDQTAKDTDGADVRARAIPTVSEALMLRDTKNNIVELEFNVDTLIIPESFDGTIYFPLKAEDVLIESTDMEVDEDTCNYARVYEVIVRIDCPEMTFNGSIIFDDVKLYKESDIPKAAATTKPAATTPEPVTSAPTQTIADPTETTATPAATKTAAPTTAAPVPSSTPTVRSGLGTGWVIGIIAAVIIAAGAGTYYFVIKGIKKSA